MENTTQPSSDPPFCRPGPTQASARLRPCRGLTLALCYLPRRARQTSATCRWAGGGGGGGGWAGPGGARGGGCCLPHPCAKPGPSKGVCRKRAGAPLASPCPAPECHPPLGYSGGCPAHCARQPGPNLLILSYPQGPARSRSRSFWEAAPSVSVSHPQALS